MTTSNQQEGKLTDAELRSLRLLGQAHYGNSLYSDHITYQHELQTLIEQMIEAREEIAERKGRIDSIQLLIETIEQHGNLYSLHDLKQFQAGQRLANEHLSTNKPESQ